jgi:hypothetical protein
MKEYKLPIESFVGGWFINEKLCNKIINYFKKSPYKQKGIISNNPINNNSNYEVKINKKIKDSTDLFIENNFFEEPFLEYQQNLQECLNKYILRYPEINELARFNVDKFYNIQHYKKNGGFKIFHHERNSPHNSLRVLVFMTYLNDVKDGGTEFKYQKLITPAKKGLTLIWPSDFTHTHKGQISKFGEKYIVTGWFTFV